MNAKQLLRPWRLLAILCVVIILLILMLILMSNKANKWMHRAERNDQAILTGIMGIVKTTADNGSEVASTLADVVTYDQLRRVDAASYNKLSKRLDDMDIKLNKKIETITLTNTNTVYHIKDSMLIVTDTSYETRVNIPPWLVFEHKVFPEEGESETYINTYDSIAWVTRTVRDTMYPWPKRLFKPKVTELKLNNFNPNSKIGYVKQYRISD